MRQTLTRRYIWLVDLLTRRGPLSREEINEYWLRSSLSDGTPIPQRTFFHFRRAAEENLDIEIRCNNYHEYYVQSPRSHQDSEFRNWLLDSASMNSVFSGADGMKGVVLVENVPSAREFLSDVMDAIRDRLKIQFSYKGFSRSRTEEEIPFCPYVVKLYRRRWYMLGFQEKRKELRTYALDRITSLKVTKEHFTPAEDFDAAALFEDIVGITTSKAPTRRVVLKVDAEQAKYLRALPLHHSQQETGIADGYSIFEYRLKLNYELVHELLGLGSSVKVIDPPELRVMIQEEIKKLSQMYSTSTDAETLK